MTGRGKRTQGEVGERGTTGSEIENREIKLKQFRNLNKGLTNSEMGRNLRIMPKKRNTIVQLQLENFW